MCWKNTNIFLQNTYRALTKCPVENPIVLQNSHKMTKIWAKRPVPQRKHATEALVLGLKQQFTHQRHLGALYFCCEKRLS